MVLGEASAATETVAAAEAVEMVGIASDPAGRAEVAHLAWLVRPLEPLACCRRGLGLFRLTLALAAAMVAIALLSAQSIRRQ